MSDSLVVLWDASKNQVVTVVGSEEEALADRLRKALVLPDQGDSLYAAVVTVVERKVEVAEVAAPPKKKARKAKKSEYSSW